MCIEVITHSDFSVPIMVATGIVPQFGISKAVEFNPVTFFMVSTMYWIVYTGLLQ